MLLVTGGAGYIGSHFVLGEREKGREVLVLDNLVRGHEEALLGAPFIQGDIADRTLLSQIFERHSVDAVVHFAAYAYVGESVGDPAKYYRNNVSGTLALLEAMRDHGVRQFVFSSSCATYGNPRYTPMDEAHPQDPINPYGESKYVCEKILQAFDRAHGLRFVSLRYFNAAGADPKGRLGESHDPEPHLIPLILQVAGGKRSHVSVFGNDYDTPDGTCIRDYIHIQDLGEAHSLALEHLRSGGESRFYNLGTEKGNSVLEAVETARSVTGRDIAVETGPRREGDPPKLVASAVRIRKELGWSPRYGELRDIIETAWRWELNRRF